MSSKGTVLITGGAKRIGKAISVFFAVKGYNIALHYNNSEFDAAKIKKEIEKLGQKCILFKGNFNSPEELEKLIQNVKNSFPDLSILINNASVFEEGLFLNTTIEQLDKHLNINFKAPFFLSQSFARLCEHGQIINILDTNITRNHSKYFAYNLSKKALYNLTKMAAYELGPKIRVNAIAPGVILMPAGKDSVDIESTPLKKQGELKNILEALSYLVENNYVTGECLFVDGGEHLISY